MFAVTRHWYQKDKTFTRYSGGKMWLSSSFIDYYIVEFFYIYYIVPSLLHRFHEKNIWFYHRDVFQTVPWGIHWSAPWGNPHGVQQGFLRGIPRDFLRSHPLGVSFSRHPQRRSLYLHSLFKVSKIALLLMVLSHVLKNSYFMTNLRQKFNRKCSLIHLPFKFN